MKNSFKKYTVVSISINILLLMMYGGCFHDKTIFSGGKYIVTSIKTVNEALMENNARTINQSVYVLNLKPKLKTAVLNLFDTNEFIVNSFICLKDSLLKRDDFSITETNIIFDEYNYALSSLQNAYDAEFRNSQKRIRFTNREIEEKISKFNQYIIRENRIFPTDSKGLSQKKSEILFMAMENHLVLVQTSSNQDFVGVARLGRYMLLNKYFPAVLDANKNDITKGERLELEIGIGFFRGTDAVPFSVYLNGKKIEMNDYIYNIELDADALEKQHMEAIVNWTDPSTYEAFSDSTYFEYTVIK